MDQRVKEFFLQYQRANSSTDVSAVGELYADTFMFGGPNGVQTVIPKMKAHFSSIGLFETQLQSVETSPISSKYLLAKATWRMTIRNSSGHKHVDTFATYILLRGQDDVLSIVFQIDHQDLASVLKDQQNTH